MKNLPPLDELKKYCQDHGTDVVEELYRLLGAQCITNDILRAEIKRLIMLKAEPIEGLRP